MDFEFDPVETSSAEVFETNQLHDEVSFEENNQEKMLNGLTAEEAKDPNKIKVTVRDNKTPIVVLFGPPACGKTMTLVRLTRFLKEEGYTVKPLPDFRPAYDDNYKHMCENFDSMIASDRAASATQLMNFMLVRVSKGGKVICQILEAPGEHYFDPNNLQDVAVFPRYVHAVINSKNRKIWTIMTEPAETTRIMDTPQRSFYVDKIRLLKKNMKSQDKVIFLFNKIDETPFMENREYVHIASAKKEVRDLYPGIFVPFKNQNPITRLWHPDYFDFCPFQTGDFIKANDGTLVFEEGDSIFPRKLWNIILKRVRG